MPDYNLGRAHGTIRIDYDKSGAKDAREDIKDVGDEATRSSKKIDDSTSSSNKDFEGLAASAKKASESLNFDTASTEQMSATVKKLEKDVTSASTAAFSARAKLQAAEENLAEVRNRSASSAKEVADAEKAVRTAQQQTVSSVKKLENNTKALNLAREKLSHIPNPDLTPDVDNSQLSQFIAHLKQIQQNTGKSASVLNTFSGRLKIMTVGVAVLIPQIAGLGVALASLSGLAGVAAGALASLGAVGATAATGMSGIGDAFKAAGAAAKSAGGSAGASAKAQRAAARSIEDAKRSLADAEENLRDTQVSAAKAVIDAQRQVVSAQRSLVSAQRDALRAQQALNEARQQAVRDLEDMQFALTGGSLDERQAILDVKKAQEELNAVQRDPTANADDIEQATINLQKQQLALEQTRKENQRLAVDSAAATAAGVEGSAKVVDAQDNAREATQSVADAQQSLADAQEGVKQAQVDGAKAIADAFQAVIDAQRNLAEAYVDAADAGGAAGAKLNDALANLSPNARAFVQEVIGLKGAWDSLRKSVQDKLFAGLAAEVQPLAQQWFPILEKGMGGVATALNGIIKETVDYLKTAEAQQNVANIFDNTGKALSNMKGIVRDLLAAFLDIASVGSDFLPDLATGAGNAAKNFRDFINEAKESGKLKEWMQGALDTAKTLWQLIKNLASIIGSVFKALDQEGGGALNTLTALTGQIAKFLKSAEGQDALHALGRILASIGGAVGKVFITFLTVVGDLLVRIEPFITSFADAAGTYLAGALKILGVVLKPIADLLGFLGPALGPIVAGMYAANKAVNAAKAVWGALNTVMNGNPFIAIAGAIIALVILIIQNWDTISAKLSEIWNGIKEVATTVWTAISDFFTGIWNSITGAITTAWNAIGSFFTQKWNEIKTSAVDLWNGLLDFFKNIGVTIGNTIKNSWNAVLDFFKGLPGKIWDFVSSLPGKFLDLGKNIVLGILRGLGNLASALWNKLKEAVSSAWDSVLSFFGINSPSKLAAEAGQNIVAGLVRGIDRSANTAVAAAASMAAAVGNELTGASGTLAMSANLAANSTITPNVLSATAASPALAAAATRGGDGASSAGTVVNVQNLTLQVAGNLDPTNPTAYRRTIVNLKDAIRKLDKEYA